VAEKLDDISVSEEQFEAETSNAPDAVGGESPRKSQSGSGGAKAAKQRAGTPGFPARTATFVRDTRAEMRRVSWPTANEVKNTTIITLVAVVFFALYLFGVDRVWAFLIDHLRVWLGGT
jgi:preprotein translocase subunit SecE